MHIRNFKLVYGMLRAAALWLLAARAMLAHDPGPDEAAVLRAVRGRDARLPCGRGRVFLDGPGAYVLWLKNDRELLRRFPDEDDADGGAPCADDACADRTALLLPRVSERDAGRYRCRVHYQASPSVDHALELRLVDSPGAPHVYDENGDEILGGYVGPLGVGADLTLVCRLDRGDPDTLLYWRRNGVALAPERESTSTERSGRSVTVHARNLSRAELNAHYECVAQNADVSAPLVAAVVVRMFLAPLSVQIRLDDNVDFEAGQPRVVDCVVVGCAPPPAVAWLLGGAALRPSVHKELHDGNYTVSSLTLAPSLRDHGGELVCRVLNAHLPGRTFEDRVVLNVGYRPACVPGGGETVGAVPPEPETLTCAVDAAPEPLQFAWTFADGRTLYTGVAKVAGHRQRYRSTLTWAAREGDLGPLLCRATNAFGEQRRPCRYVVAPGGPPLAPDCTLLAAPPSSLRVQCRKGWDGGRAQTVHLELRDEGGAPLRNASDAAGHFVLRGLDLRRNLSARVFCSSARGAGPAVTLYLHARGAAPAGAATAGGGHARWLLAGAGAALLAAVALGTALCCRARRARRDLDPDLVPRPDGSFHREPDFAREERAAPTTTITVNQLASCRNQYTAGGCRVLAGPAAPHSYYV